MKAFTGYVPLKNLAASWRGLEFLGFAFGRRLFIGVVRFDHKLDDASKVTPILTPKPSTLSPRRSR